MNRFAQLSTFGLSLALVACGQEPTQEDYDDIATSVGAVIADDTGSEIEAAQDAMDAASGRLPSGMSQNGSGQLAGQRGSLDYSFDLNCRDASGTDQAECNDLTDWAQLTLAWNGGIETRRRTASMDRTGDWTLSGLTTSEATLNGNGTFDLDSEFQALYRPVSRTFRLNYAASYDNVLIRTSDRQPIGGTITYDIDAARTASRRFRDVEASFTVQAEVTFDGSGTATIVLDGDRTYIVDTQDGDVVQL